MTTIIENVLERMERVKQTGSNRWKARCPAPGHNDTRPSLDIALGDNGKVLFDCKSNHCSFSEICKGLGLSESSMFPGRNGDGAIVATYDYRNESGDIVYKICRTANKEFPVCSPNGKWGLNGAKKVLYRLPELLKSDAKKLIFLCEGEKDTDNVRSKLKATATSSPFGAGKWKDDYNIYLKNRSICIIPHNDPQGKDHALQVAKSLYRTAKKIRILYLPDMDKGGDISDWLSNGGTREQFTEILKQAKPFDSTDTGMKIGYACFSDIVPKKIEWFWPNKIPSGAITMISGDPDIGKSFLTIYMACQISKGSIWPDCPSAPSIKGSTIFIADEDHREKAIRPRLDANGADVSKIFILNSDEVFAGEKTEFFSLTHHLEGLEWLIKKIGDVRLIIIDPITGYLGKTNANSNAEVRAVLTPLAALAERNNIVIIGLNHLNKKSEQSYMYRGMGSQAFTAQARSAWAVKLDPDDEDMRIFGPIKSNYAIKPTGFRFKIVDNAVLIQSEPWTGRMDDLGDDDRTKTTKANEWVLERLKNGAVLSTTIFEEGQRHGFKESLLHRVKKLDKEGAGLIKAVPAGSQGKWYWELRNAESGF